MRRLMGSAAAAAILFSVVLIAPVTAGLGSDSSTTSVAPVSVSLGDGSTETTYTLPGGTVITSVTPPPGFDPLTATDASLTEYGFPLAPTDPDEYQAWFAAMSAFKSDDPPTDPLTLSLNTSGTTGQYGTVYTNWGGYVAGTWNVQNHTYVAVKANVVVPSNTGTCSSTSDVGFWIGLGGTGGTYAPANLVQQGIECGNTHVGSGSSYRPFMEFAGCSVSSCLPLPFCGLDWTLAATHVIYQNMSFQTSQNKAFFYLEDESTGVIHSCSATPPSPWHWDLNTAEWIGESAAGSPIDFHSVQFSNAHTELNSNGTWVTLGSQPVTKTIEGQVVGSHIYDCIIPGAISSGTVFTDSWVSSQCYGPY